MHTPVTSHAAALAIQYVQRSIYILFQAPRFTDGYDTSSASDSSEMICTITEGNEINAASDFTNESCGLIEVLRVTQ